MQMIREPVAGSSAELVPGSGAAAKGEFVCLQCGYGIVVSRVLPSCPMCGGMSWGARTRLSPRAQPSG
ncbi:MAG: hypothetical protein ACXVZP_03720 [Gaiellaceae bacterium]